jgi:hypothetical protein
VKPAIEKMPMLRYDSVFELDHQRIYREVHNQLHLRRQQIPTSTRNH